MDLETNKKLDECKRLLGIEENKEIAEAPPRGPKWKSVASAAIQGQKEVAATVAAAQAQDLPKAKQKAWATVQRMASVLKGMGFESDFRVLNKALGMAPKR